MKKVFCVLLTIALSIFNIIGYLLLFLLLESSMGNTCLLLFAIFFVVYAISIIVAVNHSKKQEKPFYLFVALFYFVVSVLMLSVLRENINQLYRDLFELVGEKGGLQEAIK